MRTRQRESRFQTVLNTTLGERGCWLKDLPILVRRAAQSSGGSSLLLDVAQIDYAADLRKSNRRISSSTQLA